MDLGVATFLKYSCNNFALAGDAFLAVRDEPWSLIPHCWWKGCSPKGDGSQARGYHRVG
jgi:hypothetical protein